MFLLCVLVFLVPFASLCVSFLCFCTGCFEVLLWVLQSGVVGDPQLSMMSYLVSLVPFAPLAVYALSSLGVFLCFIVGAAT